MKQEKENRTHQIAVWLTPSEYDLLHTRWRQSTARTFREYLRKILFGKPITIRHRNQSLDDVMITLILLHTELSIIGHNCARVIEKLHGLREIEPVANWLREHDGAWQAVDQKITEIKAAISQIDDKWLQ
jgi:hypothetical protein